MNRRGSALLVVLGMLAFMVISAVAFSAYMRHARLPSSYLRRASSSRHLAKAALAQAIDMIDAMIGNDRYPGLGTGGGAWRWPRKDGQARQRNYWTERCFIGTNELMSVDETVSTLTLEGLAYLPPALINEARYYSRRSASAAWHTFGFDSGRFAFSAFDVTDCLDVSRLMADFGRDGSDRGRIKLAYAFENSGHTGFQVPPSEWDTFMEKFRDEEGGPDSSKVPFTSLADFNLALAAYGPSALVSPFCRFIKSGEKFVTDTSGTEAELQRHMLFVTDSWFPQTNPATATAQTIVDISSGKHQPFYGTGSDKEVRNETTVDDLAENINNTFLSRYKNELNQPEVVMLYDYLDRDSTPSSLALPTTERTPMITGVSLDGEIRLVAEQVADGGAQWTKPGAPENGQNVQYKTTAWKLRLVCDSLNAMAGAVFPFKYERGTFPTFKAQAAMSITLVPSDAATDNLRPGASSGWVVEPKWSANTSPNPTEQFWNGQAAGPAGITVFSREASVKPKKTKVIEEEDAIVADLSLDFGTIDGKGFAKQLEETDVFKECLCTFRISQKQIEVVNPATGQRTWQDVPEADGGVQRQFGATATRSDLADLQVLEVDKEYVPSVQIWVRITADNANKKTVDLVPACALDDALTGGQVSEWLKDKEEVRGSATRPVLRFYDKNAVAKVTFANNELKVGGAGTAALDVWPKGYMADDPRFNYAPENLWAMDTEVAFDSTSDGWLGKQRSGGRDGDIFMATSDAGYMQSPYELAFIPRITGLSGGSGWGLLHNGQNGGYNGKARTTFGGFAADDAMWRTYTQYECGGKRDYISALGIRTGSKGFRMTPYAASKETMMAVFANTPLDWWAASTNDQKDAWCDRQQITDSLDEAVKYTFSDHSTQAKVKYEDMETLAEYVRGRFRSENDSWEKVWDDLGWDGNDLEKLFGVDLKVPFHSVDRKFLHGYWRECFSDRQQLFLIFIRAEPMMMGGGAIGQTPPQLGARAVALVWRDPAPTPTDNDGEPRPHRTRVLFYRQFD